MKNTIIEALKSKVFWGIVTLQVIAIEPFIPLIKQYLPSELSYITTLVLPVVILWAKVMRDKGILDDVKSSAKKRKTIIKKKVTNKIGEQLNKDNNNNKEQGE